MPTMHRSSAAALALALALAPAAPAIAGDDAGTVHVNAIKNPELHTYRAVVAGLDKFDQLHALAPAVPQLRFQVAAHGGKGLGGQPLAARIAADEFSIPLALDQELRFSVPRSQAAYDAKAEMILNRKKDEARIQTYVRSPGLAPNLYRMGDIRLDCQVKIAIVKEEIPFWVRGLVNSFMLTSDWCAWFKGATPNGDERNWSHEANAVLAAATLREGGRRLALEVEGKRFRIPIGDASWGNDALIELEYAFKAAPPPPDGMVILPEETRAAAP